MPLSVPGRAAATAAAVFAVAALLAANYHLNHFYARGAPLLDSGWFAFLATQAGGWPMPNLPAVGGGTYFSSHFSPVFYGLTALSRLAPQLPPAVAFSLSQGAWYGLTGLAVFLQLRGGAAPAAPAALPAAAVSLAAAFNGVALATLGFPHFEIGIPAALLLFLALWLGGHRAWAGAALALGLSMREDAGLHYFGVFLLLALAQGLEARRRRPAQHALPAARLALACLAYVAAAMALQKAWSPDGPSALVRVYLGEPAYAHLDGAFLRERLRYLLDQRPYVLAPLAAAGVLAAWRRDALVALGAAAVLPWVAFSAAGVSPQAGTLTSYYAFPVAVAILWPAVAWRLRGGPRSGARGLADTALVVAVSIAGFAAAGGNHDDRPWTGLGFAWVERIGANQRAVDRLLGERPAGLALFVDDAVASLRPERVGAAEYEYLLGLERNEVTRIDAFAFRPGAADPAGVRRIIDEAGVRETCRLGDSDYWVATRPGVRVPGCEPAGLPAGALGR